jgi:hypothetical protein
MDARMLKRLFALLMLLAIVQLLLQANFLPALLADRFDGGGFPRHWVERGTFILRRGLLLALLPILFLMLPAWVVRRWPRRWTWRGRAYWLAPERREATVAAFSQSMLWLGLASTVLAVVVTQLVFEANGRKPPHLDVTNLWRAMAAFVAYLAVWTWRLWRRFSRSRQPQGG